MYSTKKRGRNNDTGSREFFTIIESTKCRSILRDAPYTSAAKTGSAEFETGKETHAWFTGFAPAESPKVVVTVLVEEGGSGGRAAAPVARQLFDLYMARLGY